MHSPAFWRNYPEECGDALQTSSFGSARNEEDVMNEFGNIVVITPEMTRSSLTTDEVGLLMPSGSNGRLSLNDHSLTRSSLIVQTGV